MWSDDSTDAIGGTAKQSWDFYDGFAKHRPDYPALTLSHEISQAGIEALKNGTVVDLVNAGVNLLTTAQCIHEDPYEYVALYLSQYTLFRLSRMLASETAGHKSSGLEQSNLLHSQSLNESPKAQHITDQHRGEEGIEGREVLADLLLRGRGSHEKYALRISRSVCIE
ncbi:14236_t:CDS:2, partial [Acaulospora colombiana]